MSTANFKDMKHDIPFYMLDCDGMDENDIEFVVDQLEEACEQLNNELYLFSCHCISGYWCGYQLYASVHEPNSWYSETEWSYQKLRDEMDDDGAYYFTDGKCQTAAEFWPLYEEEQEKVAQWFEQLAADYGLIHIRTVGRFSNGETIYEKVR